MQEAFSDISEELLLFSCEVVSTLCDPMDCSMPGSHAVRYLADFAQICPLSWWCYLTISSSAGPFTFCLLSFPASGSFPTSGLFVSGSQSIGVLASARVLPMNIQDWFPLGSAGLISLLSVHTNCTQIKKLRYGLQRDYAEITLKDLRIRGWRGSR